MRWLTTFTALLIGLRLFFSLSGEAIWPLSTYQMFSERIYNPEKFYYFTVKNPDSKAVNVYPWELMPMDIYRSYNLVLSQKDSPEKLIEAIKAYQGQYTFRRKVNVVINSESEIRLLEKHLHE